MHLSLWVLSLCLLLVTCAEGQSDGSILPPRLISNLTSEIYFRELADEIDLQCLAEGIPAPSYVWKKTTNHGTPEERTETITPSSMFAIHGGRLTISNPVVNAVPMAEGLYQCFASNSYGTAMSREVDVKYAFISKFPTAPARITRATEGAHVMLPCTYAPNSDPAAIYNWIKESGGIRRSSRVAVGLDGSLHIINVEPGDEQASGRFYNCSLYNPLAGSTAYGASALLNVTSGNPQNRPPTIAYHRSAVVGMLGERAELQCIPDGNPIPDITWRYPPIGRRRVEDFSRLLVIFDLVETDDRTYTCEATSSGGTSERTTIRLKVRSKPIWEVKPEAQTVPEGETATFRCMARGTQSDTERVIVHWYRNGIKLRFGANDHNIYAAGNKLTVHSLVKPDHIMNIQCKVSNSWGSDIADAPLNVIERNSTSVEPSDNELLLIEKRRLTVDTLRLDVERERLLVEQGRLALERRRFEVEEGRLALDRERV